MELIIYSPNEKDFLQTIDFNHEEIKKELAESLKKYEGLTYTEDAIKFAKMDRATLNKFRKAIETRRIEIKEQCMKPYDDFALRVKEIIEMIDKPIIAIDGQVKKFEEKVKADKKSGIETLYTESIGDLSSLLPLAKVWNEKWLNSATTMKSIKEEITTAIDRVKNDLEVISNLQSEFSLQVKDVYLKTLNLSAALQEKTRLEDQKAKQEAYDKTQAENRERVQKARLEAEEKLNTMKPLAVTVEVESEFTPTPRQTEERVIEPEVIEPELKQIDFRIWATSEQLSKLKAFLVENGINYGKVV